MPQVPPPPCPNCQSHFTYTEMVTTGEQSSWTNPLLIALFTPACGCGCLLFLGMVSASIASVSAPDDASLVFSVGAFMFIAMFVGSVLLAARSAKTKVRSTVCVCRECGHRWML